VPIVVALGRAFVLIAPGFDSNWDKASASRKHLASSRHHPKNTH